MASVLRCEKMKTERKRKRRRCDYGDRLVDLQKEWEDFFDRTDDRQEESPREVQKVHIQSWSGLNQEKEKSIRIQSL